jgi:multiple sugar transport system ATP-binding protein
VTVGVRPEHLQPAEGGTANFETVVEVVEPVGNEAFLNLRAGPQPLVARLSPRSLPQPGDVLAMRVVAEALHFFDPASGQRMQAI